MDKPYAVSLQDAEDLPAAEKIAAENRFIKEIERSLGSSAAVVDVYRAWCEASECDHTEVSADTWALAIRWPKAFETAQRAGLKNMGESQAHFDLRLDRQMSNAY